MNTFYNIGNVRQKMLPKARFSTIMDWRRTKFVFVERMVACRRGGKRARSAIYGSWFETKYDKEGQVLDEEGRRILMVGTVCTVFHDEKE